MPSPIAVRAREVGHRYPGGRPGLVSASLEAGPGEVLALIGPNGSGKSTLLRLLATDLAPTSGVLEILGRTGPPADPGLRSRIGFAPDHPVHLEPLTGDENLALFRRIRRARAGRSRTGREGPAPGASGLPDSTTLARTFGLAEVLTRPVSTYSFGMRRKLLLADALSDGAPLRLLDEPTVGLDPDGVETLGRLLGSAAARGETVVLATNEVRDVPDWASRVVFLHRGGVVADASPAALLAGVRGRTLVTLSVSGGAPDLTGIEGAKIPQPEGEPGADGGVLLRVESERGGRILPALLQRVLDGGGEVRDVRVREPDLRDVFEHLTGSRLDDGR